MTTFLSLLKKDWRVNLGPILGSIILVVMAHVVALATLTMEKPGYVTLRTTAERLINGAMIATFIMALQAAAFGGVAFAAERRERSAEFLAMLPVPRGQMILSKLVLAITFLVAVDLTQVVVILLLLPLVANPNAPHGGDLWEAFAIAWSLQLLAIGIAWTLSTFLGTATIPACIAIAAFITLPILFSVYGQRSDYTGPQMEHLMSCTLTITAATIGALSLTAGSLYYLLRIEP